MSAAVAATTMESATAAAMEPTATTVESATAAMESTATTVESTAAVKSATVKAAPASEPSATVEPAPAVKSTATKTAPAESTTTAEPAIAKEAAAPEAPTAEPRASADKDAAYEVIRAVVTVRRAGVGIITVIAVITDRCSTVVAAHWTNSDAHRPLRIGVRRSNQGKCQASA